MSESTPPPPMDYQTPTGGLTPPTNKDEQNMGLLIFILAIFTGFIGPLIIWLLKKESSRYLDEQGKEVLNWSITVFLAAVVCMVLVFVFIGVLLLPLLMLTNLILNILGAIAASKGQPYRYPFAIRLLK